MGARFVAINVQVNGTQQGAAEIKTVTNAFTQMESQAHKAGSGGLRNAFTASSTLRSEMAALGSQIPIVGRLFSGATSDLLRYAAAGNQVIKQNSAVKSSFGVFQNAISSAFRGKNDDVGRLFKDIGINVEQAVTKPLPAFKTFLTHLNQIPDAEDRAAFAMNVFGNQTAKLLPTLEGLAAGEAEVTAATSATGGSMLAILGPIALVIAIVAAMVGGLVLGGKALFDLTKLAADTGSEIYNLSTKVNFSAETLSALKIAAETSGSSLQSISASLGIFDKNIQLANESDTKLAKQFRDFNIDISNNETALRSVFKALAALPDGAKQTELAMLAFGRSGKEVLGIVKETNGDLDVAIKKYGEMGLVISGKAAKAAHDFDRDLVLLESQIKMVGVQIGFQLLPYVQRLVDGFSRLITENGPGIQRWAQDTIGHLKNVGTAVQGLAAAVVTVETGGLVEDDGGAWLMGKLLHWGTGAGAITSVLDKLGAAIRGVQPQPATGLSGDAAKRIKDNFVDKFQDARDKERLQSLSYAQLLKELPSSEVAKLEQATSASKQRVEELQTRLENLAESTNAASTALKIHKDKQLELPPVLQFATAATQREIAANNSLADSLSRKLDQAVAEKKAADEAAKATENFTNETATLRQRLIDMTQDQSKATTEVQKFQEALAGGKYKNVGDENIKARLEILGKLDAAAAKINHDKELEKAAEAQFKFANSVQAIGDSLSQNELSALSNFDQGLIETHTNLKRVTDEIAKLSEIHLDRAKFDDFVKKLQVDPSNLAGAQNAFRALLSPEVRQKVGNDQTDDLVSFLVRAIGLDKQLFEAQLPLNQLDREHNALLREQSNLNDPVLASRRVEIELLRDKISLQQRDLDAVIATNRAQLELADATTYHATQANAKVVEFLAHQKNITEIVADAKTGLIQTSFDYIDSGLQKMNSHLGKMGNLLTQIESDFIRLALNKFFLWLLGGQGGAQGGGIGSAVGQAVLGGGAFANGRNGATASFTSGGGSGIAASLQNIVAQRSQSFFSGSGVSFNEGITAPTTTLSSQAGGWGGIQNAAKSAGSATISGGSSAFSLAGMGSSFGSIAPLLGLGLGSQLGGSSRLGSIIGGAGGLLGGGAIGALLGAGIFDTGGIAAAGGALSFLPGLLTNPFTLAAIPLILFTAWKLGQLAQRRKDETKRAELSGNVYNDVIQILNNTRSGQLSSSEAMSQYNQVKTNYFASVGQMKDAKTKRIATDWWNRDFDPVYRPLIEQAGKAADAAKIRQSKLQPEFRDGGSVFARVNEMRHLRFADGGMFAGRVPGAYDRRDNNLIAVSGDEVVLTPKQWRPITSYLKAAKVPGFAEGGAGPKANSFTAAGGSDQPFVLELTVENRLVVSDSDASGIVVTGVKTSDGRKAIVKVNQSDRASRSHF